MRRPIFRRAALERLSSPERLDELIEVTTPRLWLVLFGVCMLLLAVVGWGFYGSVPTTVRGQGLLIRDASLQTVDASDAGPVKDPLVRVGDDVQRDEVVSRPLQAAEPRT